MKKIIAHLLTISLCVCMLFGCYPDVGKIVRFDEENDLVYVRTCNGFIWSFYGIEDLEIGNMLGLLFYDNGTPLSIYDDQIIDIKYAMTIIDFLDEDDFIWFDERPEILEETFIEIDDNVQLVEETIEYIELYEVF